MKIDRLNRLFYQNYKASATEERDDSLPNIRTRDAATLIIIDNRRKTPKILMGKRARGHKFLPGKFVFPGGAIDACDSRLVVAENLRAPVMRKLRQHVPAHINDKRLRGLALAAIRETFEETGLVIGRKAATQQQTKSAAWQHFFAKGATPALKNIDFIGRAITPPKRVRRFDTRFFAVEATELYHPQYKMRNEGELLDLHWLSLQEARALDLPIITRMTLDYLESRLQTPLPQRYQQAAFFFHATHGKPHVGQLT